MKALFKGETSLVELERRFVAFHSALTDPERTRFEEHVRRIGVGERDPELETESEGMQFAVMYVGLYPGQTFERFE